MPKVICIIGKICCGKTTYANTLPGMLLSIDDVMLPMFGQDCEILLANLPAMQHRLMCQATQCARPGHDVILDWGFWTRKDRKKTAAFFALQGVEVEWHYIDIPEQQRQAQIRRRNHEIIEQGLAAYYVHEGLAQKCNELFEEPEELHELKRV